jgi:hypothetical protein
VIAHGNVYGTRGGDALGEIGHLVRVEHIIITALVGGALILFNVVVLLLDVVLRSFLLLSGRRRKRRGRDAGLNYFMIINNLGGAFVLCTTRAFLGMLVLSAPFSARLSGGKLLATCPLLLLLLLLPLECGARRRLARRSIRHRVRGLHSPLTAVCPPFVVGGAAWFSLLRCHAACRRFVGRR